MQLNVAESFFPLPIGYEMGNIKIMHLKRFWAKSMAQRSGSILNEDIGKEWETDLTLLSVLGLGLEQTLTYLYREYPSFNEFENWILQINNHHLAQEKIEQFNQQLTNTQLKTADLQVLNQEDMDFWNKNGYFISRSAIPKADCEATIQLICDFLSIDLDQPSTWYQPHPARQGIMVQLFQHSLLQKNRDSPIIKAVFRQLWGREDIWVNTDRVGFNPPETDSYHFPGPGLHWDVSLELPIPFGLQGILYLSDTKANQGAFTLVPGFQNRIDAWIHSLPAGTNPRMQDINALGAKPIAANAGDFIIWHQALPHGSSPNTAQLPRIVQYINYSPINPAVNDIWK